MLICDFYVYQVRARLLGGRHSCAVGVVHCSKTATGADADQKEDGTQDGWDHLRQVYWG